MRGSIVSRGKGVYLVRISLGRDDVTGKRLYHTETVHGSKKEAEARNRDLVSEFERGVLSKRSTKSLNEFLRDWLATAKTKLRERTWSEYVLICDRYLTEDLGRFPLDKLTPLRIQKVYGAMSERGLSSLTVRRLHTVLNQALKQAVKWRMLPHNPAADVELPRRRVQKVQRAMTTLQAIAFIEAARQHRWGMVLVFALLTGMRPEEYLALQWSDIDLAAAVVKIERVLVRPKGGGWKFEQPKTDSSRRSVVLDRRLIQDLRAHKIEQAKLRLLVGPVWKSEHDFVFTAETGSPISSTNLLLRGFKPTLERAGLPKEFRLYDLRHTHATLLLQAGEHPKVVSERLGHSTITLTMDTYSSVMPTMQVEAARRVGDLLYTDSAEKADHQVITEKISLLRTSSNRG